MGCSNLDFAEIARTSWNHPYEEAYQISMFTGCCPPPPVPQCPLSLIRIPCPCPTFRQVHAAVRMLEREIWPCKSRVLPTTSSAQPARPKAWGKAVLGPFVGVYELGSEGIGSGTQSRAWHVSLVRGR